MRRAGRPAGVESGLDRRQCLVAAAAMAPGVGLAQPKELPAAVHRAGVLLTQSQRLAKAYALWGLKMDVDDARRVVTDCLALSTRTIGELSAAAPTLRPTYAALGKLWDRAAALVAQSPTPQQLDALLVLDQQLLGVANEGLGQLLRQGTAPELAAVDTAHRLSMLTQRLAKFHFCALWGVAPRLAASQIARSRDDFQAHLGALKSAGQTAAQRQALEAASSQWVFFDAALQHSTLGAEAAVHTRLSRASETILQAFHDLAAKFARVA